MALIRRGARLARRGNARCTVLTLGPPAGEPGDWTAAVQIQAQDTGAAIIARQGRDTVAVIAQAVRETGARRLVIAAPPAGLLDRWRRGLAERLASQLPDVHLHITAGQARPSGAAPDGADSPDRAPGVTGRQPHATVRVYLGYAARLRYHQRNAGGGRGGGDHAGPTWWWRPSTAAAGRV